MTGCKGIGTDARLVIRKGLTGNPSFAETGRQTGKDPAAVSREVRSHTGPCDSFGRGANHNRCIHKDTCDIAMTCPEAENTRRRPYKKSCSTCRPFACPDYCDKYEEMVCGRLSRPPYVCNGCPSGPGCRMRKQIACRRRKQKNKITVAAGARGHGGGEGKGENAFPPRHGRRQASR